MQNNLRTKWQGLRLLVIDEISMVTNRNLSDLDRFCRALTNRFSLPLAASSPWLPETSANYHPLEANTSLR